MGLIRLLLALAVVGAHSNSHVLLKFTSGDVAVQAFYIISGFYMAMVYRNYASAVPFWKSRYLRLYPTYICCGLLSFFLLRGGFAAARTFWASPAYPLAGKIYLAFTNLTILFQDQAMFLGMSNGQLHFTTNFNSYSPATWEFLWVQQGWSLGLELMFYFLVPFILNRSSRLIVLLMAMSVAIRVVLQSQGLAGDPWSYRFFPSELALFLLGSMAYRIHAGRHGREPNEHLQYVIFSVVVAFVAFFPFLPLDLEARKIVFYLVLAGSLGVVFDLTRRSRVDNFLGMLSYPIYCVHLVVIGYLLPKIGFIHPDSSVRNTALTYLLIVALSAIIHLAIERPIDIFRARYKRAAPRPAQVAKAVS